VLSKGNKMKKFIKSLEKTNKIHPAVGALYIITYEDGTTEELYEEFLFQSDIEISIAEQHRTQFKHLIGKHRDILNLNY